ncbi:serine hydrolase (plasmid) [Pseudohalocynthiibacter aestuariivivens]|nr:serine hydrolase [Pseudohalocynthiibacter aestuariivivens]QIE48035.1 serine hydrolase [Pseudohalocynthiibacter aestuariivivens]
MKEQSACEQPIPLDLMLATYAKVVGSGIFLSRRELDEVVETSGRHALWFYRIEKVLLDAVKLTVDPELKEVEAHLTLEAALIDRIIAEYAQQFPDFSFDHKAEKARLASLSPISRKARCFGRRGCVILPATATESEVAAQFDDRETSMPFNPERSGNTDLPRGQGSKAIDEAVDLAFADSDAATSAVVILHKGQIIAERYRDGVDATTPLESWSMGKGLTATLVGMLVQAGALDPDKPAPIPEWHAKGDPRSEITVRHLLQMSGGLDFSGKDDPRSDWAHGVSDHEYIYTEAVDTFRLSIEKGMKYPPGTCGRYRNCDTLALGLIIRRYVEDNLGRPYLTWPQEELFDVLKADPQILETDWFGNFVMSGFNYGPARNWAKLGLLYLQKGVWKGKRLLPTNWGEQISTPSPAWDEPEFGGQVWLNRTKTYELPSEAYYMAGSGEQRVFIVPSIDLVIVRMGFRADNDAPTSTTKKMCAALMRANWT